MAANHFETGGYRDHSEASRDQFNAKLRFMLDSDTRVTLIGNTLYQPEAQDPLGLTRAQVQANRRQVDPAATLFDTRKTVGQQQGGMTIERSVGADTTLRLTGYAGHRSVRQYLALSGIGDTSSGGVTDLDGNFGGVDARVTTRFMLAGGPLSLTVGAAYDRQDQARKGFVNNNGALGDLRRDEDDTVHDQDVYAQAEWSPLASLSLLAGARYSDVRFVSDDHYITATNPNDSGRVAFSHASPVAGIVWHAAKDVNIYANWGDGFETPTFIELAYRNVGTGLNFGLQPAISRSTEIGVKAYVFETQRVNLAAFSINTTNEIIIDAATGGRTTYKNAGKTRRRGVEAQWEGALGGGFTAYAAYTYLSATFAADTTTGTPPQLVRAGSRLARGAGKRRLCRAGMDARRLVRFLGRAGISVRGQVVRQRPQHRCRGELFGRQRPRRFRAAHGHVDAARIRARQQSCRPQLCRIGDRGRHQRAIFRAGRGPQFSGRRKRQCQVLSTRPATRRPRSCCIG